MPKRAFLERADVAPSQRVTCPDCVTFVEFGEGIRGPAFEQEGRRHFYTVAGAGPFRRSRCGPRYGVSPSFFHGVAKFCTHWLGHLAAQRYPDDHLAEQKSPTWVRALIRDVYLTRPPRRAAVIAVTARLLDISPQQVYVWLPPDRKKS